MVKPIKLPNDREECFRVNVVNDARKVESNEESYYLSMDEVKFGVARKSMKILTGGML